jgi:hypothetical protein
MPTVDIDWLLSQLFGSLTVRDSYYMQELYAAADRMAYGDMLFGQTDMTQMERDDLALHILNAGAAIVRQLNQLQVYESDGYFPYAFSQYKSDGILIFTTASRTG